MKILVFGSLNKDYVYAVKHIVRPGETILSQEYQIFWGGKGFNQSVALAKAGASIFFACKVAEDDISQLKGCFASYGLPDIYLSGDGSVTGHTIIQIDEKGQNCILLYPGANYEISEMWIDAVLENFGKGDMILLQNEINNIAYIMEAAHKRGIKIAFNPSPISNDLQSYPLQAVDIFFVNEIECEEMTGEKDTDKMADAMLKKFPNAKVILTLGEKGALYIDSQNRYYRHSYSVTVVDTTAAGDTFTGFFLAEYANGASIESALQTASKAAAMSVMVKGAVNSIPFISAVNEFTG